MRFHLGFSKFISVKTIIKILGFLFVGLMAFLGFSQHEVLAWTDFSSSSYYPNFNYYEYYDRNDSYNVKTEQLYTYIQTQSSYNRYAPSIDSSPNGGTNFYLATTQGSNRLKLLDTMYFTLPFTPLSSCSTSNTDKKSLDVVFTYAYVSESNLNNYGSYFNLPSTYPENFQSLLAFDVIAVSPNSSSGDLDPNYFITACDTPVTANSYSNIGSLNKNIMVVTCHNVFSGSVDYPVTSYQVRITNKIYFNNMYNASTDTGYIGASMYFYKGTNDTTRSNYPFKYQCSDSAPVVEGGGFPSEDPNGLNDIWVDMQDNFDPDIPGIDTEQFIVNLPATFTDLLSLPLDVVKAVVNNSTGTCSPYQLDFSSLVHRWGNPNGSFIITLPCMREVLSSKLGTIYTLCDNLLCFFIFYNMAMLFINLINAILSGEDLFAFYFQPADYQQSVIHGKRGHWHVRNNFTRGGVD